MEEMIEKLMRLAMYYRSLCRHPVPLKWNAELQTAFEQAIQCYLCGCEAKADSPFVRDHDHFTGAYRGAACQSCNVKAQCPKQIKIFFHNLETFDGHYVVRAISILLKQSWERANAAEKANEARETIAMALEDKREEDVGMEDADSDSHSTASSDYDEIEDCDKEASLSDFDSCSGEELDPRLQMDPLLNAGPRVTAMQHIVPRYDYKRMRRSQLGTTTEKNMQLEIGPMTFNDSMRFNKTALAKWIKSQRKACPTLAQCFPLLTRLHPSMKRTPPWKVEEALGLRSSAAEGSHGFLPHDIECILRSPSGARP